MTKYRVNDQAKKHALGLIQSGDYDTETEWSDAAPDTDEANEMIEKQGYEAYGKWHLAIDTEASEETKDRYGFPFGDFSVVNRAALIHAKQRASQNDHDEIMKAADEVLTRLDDSSG